MKKFWFFLGISLLIFFLFLNFQKEFYTGEIGEDEVLFSYLVNGEKSYVMPKKEEGYFFSETSFCNHGVNILFDPLTWSLSLDFSSFLLENNERTFCQLNFERKKYQEEILHESIPILKDELIPVIISDSGEVRKASLYQKWYSYEEKKWANAVILKNKDTTYQEGDVILESNIESYFVWIPKYRYLLWNLEGYSSLTSVGANKVHEISILFGDYNTSDEVDKECKTPLVSGSIGNCKEGDYMTHPAFLSIPVTGFWVGKFETSKSNNNSDNSINPRGVQIKPNEVAWRNITLANAFSSVYDYQRELDSHIMKNTEWGAVAYLSHSRYGAGQKIRINNHANFMTGYASTKEPTCGNTADNRECNRYGTTSDITLPYNTSTGYKASTTGNITGIYDMSGGTWEVMMSVMQDGKGAPLSGQNATYHSGFIGNLSDGGRLTDGLAFPNSRYYETYEYNTVYREYARRILGDATGEMGPFGNLTYENGVTGIISSWYGEDAKYVWPHAPWVIRGDYYCHGTEAGVFAFDVTYGMAMEYVGFRIVLSL